MTEDEYTCEVEKILADHIEPAARKLTALLPLVPENTRQIEINILVDQGGEGFLDVRVSLDGPDLYVLNRSIDSHADLFNTVMTEQGLSPALPLMDSDLEDFPVHDVLADCGARWATAVWAKAGQTTCRFPVKVMSPEGYGTFSRGALHMPPAAK
jgi:hypothetical protein